MDSGFLLLAHCYRAGGLLTRWGWFYSQSRRQQAACFVWDKQRGRNHRWGDGNYHIKLGQVQWEQGYT